MNRKVLIPIVLLGLATQLAVVQAAEKEDVSKDKDCVVTGQSLLGVVNDAGNRLKKRFIVDPRLSSCIELGKPVDAQQLSYTDLQGLLAVHGFIDTAEVNGVIAIVPDAGMRYLPLRMIDDNERNVGEYEGVIKLIDPTPLSAAKVVPILRPMLPQYAHMVADSQTNTVLVVGRYANVRTMENLLRSMRKRPVVASAESEVTRSGAPAAK